jgi:isoamylase
MIDSGLSVASTQPARPAASSRTSLHSRVQIVPHATGAAAPLGATLIDGGVNFSLFSRTATGVDLLLFNDVEDVAPAKVIPFDPVLNRTYFYWHQFVPDLEPGQLYGYRVHGPQVPDKGLRFDPTKVLLDPYGRSVVVPSKYDRVALSQPDGVPVPAMKNAVIDVDDYDWEGDQPLRNPSARTIIYEMHVRGFTRHPNSGVDEARRGSYAGLIEKIPYLKELGVTAVELLPVFQFDAQDCPPGKVNYWGYAPISFFAPHQAYSSDQRPQAVLDEFRDMVKALHRAGLEVILDVVFNHTAEGPEAGPTLSFRGIDNATYYILEDSGREYANYTGCGNTLNSNHPVVRRLIVDSLRYWVEVMHVDGFRFDLASILSRDESGAPIPKPPVLWDIESDPVLAGTVLIAEAWDAAGLYQVGKFVGDAWKEWNGRFRDDVRDFFRGVGGAARTVADRIIGSPDIYRHKQREAEQSVNFVTCHDGFTLNDLVSYNEKRNLANGEGNRDGGDDNRSWNCGVEGPTDDPVIERLRNRQVRNLLTVTMLSLGMPMFTMGDEVRRTQRGNNNAYCQDNEISWFDWSLVEKRADLLRFVKLLNSRRVLRSTDHEVQRVSLAEMIERSHKAWHGTRLYEPDWGDASRTLVLESHIKSQGIRFFFILNAYWESLEFELPVLKSGQWLRWIDTGLDSPDDIADLNDILPLVCGNTYRAEGRSVVMLFTISPPETP